MNATVKIITLLSLIIFLGSCVPKKKLLDIEAQLNAANQSADSYQKSMKETSDLLAACEQSKSNLKSDLARANSSLQLREEQIKDLKDQIRDIRSQRDKQLNQVQDLTVLSQSASENIKETLTQLEGKDNYIKYLQAAKTRADSINLALAVNLKSVLNQGIEDEDVTVEVDKTVVFVNLSDKMLYKSGSASLTPRAKEVLGKIAQIIESRPELEVMVEGYTDDRPIKNSCMADNWDLSVKRATSVVRVLQEDYKIDPNRLIAAGRGQFNALATNETAEGRATNRRTRIIILPKLGEFYDLLNPSNAPD